MIGNATKTHKLASIDLTSWSPASNSGVDGATSHGLRSRFGDLTKNAGTRLRAGRCERQHAFSADTVCTEKQTRRRSGRSPPTSPMSGDWLRGRLRLRELLQRTLY